MQFTPLPLRRIVPNMRAAERQRQERADSNPSPYRLYTNYPYHKVVLDQLSDPHFENIALLPEPDANSSVYIKDTKIPQLLPTWEGASLLVSEICEGYVDASQGAGGGGWVYKQWQLYANCRAHCII